MLLEEFVTLQLALNAMGYPGWVSGRPQEVLFAILQVVLVKLPLRLRYLQFRLDSVFLCIPDLRKLLCKRVNLLLVFSDFVGGLLHSRRQRLRLWCGCHGMLLYISKGICKSGFHLVIRILKGFFRVHPLIGSYREMRHGSRGQHRLFIYQETTRVYVHLGRRECGLFPLIRQQETCNGDEQ